MDPVTILNMSPDDPYFTPNPYLEALDAKLEQMYYMKREGLDEEEFKITHEYVNDFNLYREPMEQMSIRVAVEYLSRCHNCGKNVEYGNTYCSKRCLEYIEDYGYSCYKEGKCIICDNLNYFETLLTTEDAGILYEDNIIGPSSVRISDEDDEWDEIGGYGEYYYYFRKGFYRCVSGIPAPRDGYSNIEINGEWYVYRI